MLSVTVTENKISHRICGKYTALGIPMQSVVEALHHCSANLHVDVCVSMVDTESIENGKLRVEDAVKDLDGIIVPGGFWKQRVGRKK